MERVVPREKWLYDDRGMMKWMGWILAGHSAYLETEQQQQRPTPARPEMALPQIDSVLQTSWQEGAAVTLQLNVLENNQHVAEFSGQVIGFNADQVYVQLNTQHLKTVYLEDIRWAALATSEKWWDHDDTLR
ncbi:hypothetical protein [Lactiplantibacillus pentosus]|uniref:hypothetical protein n=1 Tax=Lactiplantibacillus pentosus TaxID=1589 RepID=UPI00031DB6C0|nr:hypothetical protein [Lactiplantibacillus pentosus]MBQ0835818.1 DNA-directed RNA polymerase subunit beta [Lactiplantibacillus pentosus]MBU7465482.1 DNA-directed RNA polymerase subunit beta [Lactiplantibacillus pentosus]MBU7491425.1 DNA-directed RNA polymerase subunit beta [Lactiplantibacillus pentosus]MBU7494448.1 DNA-directed RNA polymerase subunit beta [Lactiplantibacillus pentosus]MBU7520464.1 DNA-directed RNA polymerase subunit beta [Lactiplantibacillus pentosus]